MSLPTPDSLQPIRRAPESSRAPTSLRTRRSPALRVESTVMVAGAGAVALGAVAEWAAPLWTTLPTWVHPLLAANESLIVLGGVSFLLASLLRRARNQSRQR